MEIPRILHLHAKTVDLVSILLMISSYMQVGTNVPEDVEAAPGHREHAGDSEHHRAKHLDVVCTRRVSSARV